MANQRFQSVWEAIEHTPFEASNMRLRSDLMIQLKSRIKERGWTYPAFPALVKKNQSRESGPHQRKTDESGKFHGHGSVLFISSQPNQKWA